MSKTTVPRHVKAALVKSLRGVPLEAQIRALHALNIVVGLACNIQDTTVVLSHGNDEHEASGRNVTEAMSRALTCWALGYAWMRLDGSTSGGGVGNGVARWSGKRRRELEAFARKHSASPDDFEVQFQFMLHELRGLERAEVRS